MATAVARVELLRNERAFLALLILVGAGSVAVGVVDLVRQNATSLPALLDLALGASVLLVTWLFLAPVAYPTYFGDARPGSVAPEAPYLRPVAPPELLPLLPAAPPAAPPDPIPKWANPNVGIPVEAAIRPHARAGAFAPLAAVARTSEAPSSSPMPPTREVPSKAPVAPRKPEPVEPWLEPELSELRERPVDRSSRGPALSREMLNELDRIEEELRSFVPIEAPPAATAEPSFSDFDAPMD
jgi:hypothetical protein